MLAELGWIDEYELVVPPRLAGQGIWAGSAAGELQERKILRRIAMPNVVRNVLAFIVGLFLGGVVNMALITVSPSLIPPPAGVDVTNPESLSAAIHLFEPRHFVMPFLAHALGTLVGALVGYLIAASYKAQIAYGIGALFLCGGVAASFMIPAPAWFIALDLVVAYLPMAWLGIRIGARIQPKTAPAGRVEV